MRLSLLWASALAFSSMGTGGSDGDFRMTVRDAFTITGRGVVLTGIVEGGPVAVDDVVCLRSSGGETRELTVKGIEQFRDVLEVAEPGMAVGLLFEGIERTDVEAGDTLTQGCD